MFKQLWWKGLYWPTLREECKAVADNCTECQQHNIQRQGFHPMSSIHASLPWEHIALDLAGPLKTSKQGYNMILVITDICTRFTIIRPLRSKMAKDVAKELFHVMADFGVPKIIQSDNGSEFVNSTIHEMKSLLGVQHRLISPYHPEANGVAEASVKVAKQLLTKNSKGDLLHWERYLPMVQMQMNCRIMNRTGSQPFELCHGRPWNDWSDYSKCQSKPLSTNELLERCKGLKDIVYPAVLNRSRTKADTEKKYFQRQHKVQDPLATGTSVMIRQVDKEKGEASYAGPYVVDRVNTGGAYILRDATGKEFPHKVPRKHLKVVAKPLLTEKEFEVEKILDHKWKNSQYNYLTKWRVSQCKFSPPA